MNVHIDIDTRTFVRFWLVVIGFAIAGIVIYGARDALILVGAALFLAVALSLPVNKLVKLLPSKSRVVSTAIAYLFVLIFFCAIIFLVVPPMIEQTMKFVRAIPDLVDAASKQSTPINEFIGRYNLQGQVTDIANSIKSATSNFAASFGTGILAGIGSLVSVIASSILVIILAFLMLVEGPTWLNKIWSVYVNKTRMEFHRKLINRMYGVITSYVIGQLSISALAGLMAGIIVSILHFSFPDVPINLIIPTIAVSFVLSLIPMFGGLLNLVIITSVLLLNNTSAALLFLVLYIIYQQIEANFIIPKIQSRRIDLSALAILISVTIGLYLFGMAGGIISIPIAGCINILIEEHIAMKRNKRTTEKGSDNTRKVSLG